MYRPKSLQQFSAAAAQHVAAAAAAADYKLELPQSTFATEHGGDSPKTPYDNDKYKLGAHKGQPGMAWALLRRAAAQQGHVLLHLLLVLLVVCLWGLHAQSVFEARRPRHLVVLDAGSTGTRVHVFRYASSGGGGGGAYAALALPEPKLKVEPGLSSFAGQPAGAAESLQPLLAFAAQHVPPSQWAATPLYLMATAGLRLLPRGDAEDILEACAAALGDSPFLFRREWASVISGTSEGLYAWVAANYAAGHLQDAAEDAAHARKDLHHQHAFKALIELGGASAQVTFIPDASGHHHGHLAADSSKHSVRLKLPGVHHPLWTHSYLGYGFDVVQNKVDALVKQAAGSASQALQPADSAAALGSPPSMARRDSSSQQHQRQDSSLREPPEASAVSATAAATAVAAAAAAAAGAADGQVMDPCLPAGYKGDDGRVGSGVWRQCQALVAQAMDPASCQPEQHTPCPEVPRDMPKLTGELLAIENFAYTAAALSLPPMSTLGDFAAAARQFCSRPWPQTLAAHSDDPQQQRFLWRYCFGSAFAWTLLHQVLRVGEGQVLHFTNALTRQDGAQLGLDWALGAAVLQLSTNSAAEGALLQQQARQQRLLLSAAVVGTAALLAVAALALAGAWRAGRLGLQAPWLTVVVQGSSGGGSAAAGAAAKQAQGDGGRSWAVMAASTTWANAAVASKGGVP